MLVRPHRAAPRRRPTAVAVAFAVAALVLIVCLAWLAPHLGSAAERVRLRNAWLYDDTPVNAAWTPATRPADFAVDPPPPLPLFAAVVADHRLRVDGDDWATARAIAHHLLQGGKRHSEPIQSDLATTYRRIVGEGRGYCGDYADVFTALAHAAGIASRSWAFSFDGFGGRGHIFNEVWDAQRSHWAALDVQNNLLFVDDRGEPLPALAIRDAFAAGRPPRMQKLRDDVRPGYVHPAKQLDFYRRGVPEWYLWWGSAVQTLDRDPLARALAPLGRSVEQAAALATGVHPRLRVVAEPANAVQRERLAALRAPIAGALVATPLTCVLGIAWWRQRRRDPHGATPAAPTEVVGAA